MPSAAPPPASDAVPSNWVTHEPTPSQHDVICGVLLTGAQLESNAHDAATLVVPCRTLAFAEYLDSHLAEFGESITETDDGITWRSNPSTALGSYVDDWTDCEGNVSPPNGYRPAAESFRIAFARVGATRKLQEEVRVVLNTQALALDSEVTRRVFDEWHPLVFDNAATSIPELYLQDGRGFFEVVGPTPIPGSAERWPDGYSRTPAVMDSSGVCPMCDEEHAHLDAHWRSSPACEPPELTHDQHEAIAGVLLGGGRLRRDTYGYYVEVQSENHALLSHLDDLFDYASRGTSVVDAESDEFVWQSRSLPSLDTYEGWMSPGWVDDGEEPTIPERLVLSAGLLRIAYGLAGSTVGPCIHLVIKQDWPSAAFVRELFEQFDPLVDDDHNGVELYNTSKFLAYIGESPLPGCADKWPSAGSLGTTNSPADLQ